MRKFILSFSVTALYIFYIIFDRSGAPKAPAVLPNIVNNPAPAPSSQTQTQTIRGIPNNDDSESDDEGLPARSSQITPKTPTPPPTTNTTPPQTNTTPVNPPANLGQYKDGSFTGQSVDAYYGFVQVKAVVQNGKITDVQFLDFPRDHGNSLKISNYAMPILRQEAITAQSAHVDVVSGATDTSQGFVQSLASALVQAKN